MASLRKKYQAQLGSPERDDGPPVLPPPATGAKMPEPAADAGPPELPETKSPADQAAESALRQRLEEMENAEALQRQQQQPRFAEEPQAPQEPQDPLAHLPPRIRDWYERHPELATDPERAAQVQYCHHVARRETGEEFTEPYYDRMEAMLGLGNGHAKPVSPPAASAPPREPTRAPPRQQQRSTQVSAPPSREVPSMRTGRPQGGPVRLTTEQLEAAQFSGVSPQEYAEKLQLMERLKAAGQLDDRR